MKAEQKLLWLRERHRIAFPGESLGRGWGTESCWKNSPSGEKPGVLQQYTANRRWGLCGFRGFKGRKWWFSRKIPDEGQKKFPLAHLSHVVAHICPCGAMEPDVEDGVREGKQNCVAELSGRFVENVYIVISNETNTLFKESCCRRYNLDPGLIIRNFFYLYGVEKAGRYSFFKFKRKPFLAPNH